MGSFEKIHLTSNRPCKHPARCAKAFYSRGANTNGTPLQCPTSNRICELNWAFTVVIDKMTAEATVSDKIIECVKY